MATPRFRTWIQLSALAAAFGCNGVSWPSERIVDSLRILGVKSEPASLTPGQSTHLSMLCADGIGGGTTDPSCNVEVAWFADCDNPPNNDPLKCLDHYAAWADQFSSPLADTPAIPQFAVSPEFDFRAPDNVLQGQVTLSGQAVQYGISYVYFAACAGHLFPVKGVTDRLPVECRDRDTNALLDQRRFVVGVTTIYSYGGIANANPQLLNPTIDGLAIPIQACASGADCGVGFDCTDSTCAPVVRPCSRDIPGSCNGHCLNFQVPGASFHLTQDSAPIANPTKALWAEYYANAGSLPDDARFALHAPEPNASVGGIGTTDLSISYCAPWVAPTYATEQARLWVVVRDDRGGLSWLEQRVLVR